MILSSKQKEFMAYKLGLTLLQFELIEGAQRELNAACMVCPSMKCVTCSISKIKNVINPVLEWEDPDEQD